MVRDKIILHALNEAYRNILPAGIFPVVLLFIEMPYREVDVNVHPSKTEVRFRHQSLLHDFLRDTVRKALMEARPQSAFPAGRHGLSLEDLESPFDAPVVEQLFSSAAAAVANNPADSLELTSPTLPAAPLRLEFKSDTASPSGLPASSEESADELSEDRAAGKAEADAARQN